MAARIPLAMTIAVVRLIGSNSFSIRGSAEIRVKTGCELYFT
ncbi:5-enolpyruvylshikimate-3-phosphate synthase [Bacillus mycoides]